MQQDILARGDCCTKEYLSSTHVEIVLSIDMCLVHSNALQMCHCMSVLLSL